MTSLPNFKPAWWLNHPHLQTIWPEITRRPARLRLKHERFELLCGDFLDLGWCLAKKSDTVIVLHGLGGSINSPYVRGMMKALNDHNFSTLGLSFRGCSPELTRHTRLFHGGQTNDLRELIAALKKRNPSNRIFIVGFSLGASILLKYLGEYGEASLVDGAVAISTPFSLNETQYKLSKGFSRVYQKYLLTKIKFSLIKKLLHGGHKEIDPLSAIFARNLKIFDETVTAPLHGFKDANDYYTQSSSHFYLKDIVAPTLILHAKDDPFLPSEAIPKPQHLSQSTVMHLTDHGGHVGFVAGMSPKSPIYWLEKVVPEYLSTMT